MEFLKLYDEKNRDILYSMSWLNKNSIFDKSIGSFQEIDLFTFLENINDFDYDKDIFYDDVYYILEYTKDSIYHLINNINKEIKREHKIVSISQAKEFDKKTILWLSRQDGRTIKEKLKNNKIKAVKRYSNVDTYENRVFKIFLKKLILIDEARREIDNIDYLIGKIRQWLRSDDAKAINEYGNIVYNNILLHHPHYSKIFKGYKWLNRLDEKVSMHISNYSNILNTIIKLESLNQLQFNTKIPLLPNYIKMNRDFFEVSIANPLIKIDVDDILKNTYKKYHKDNIKINKTRNFIKIELTSVIDSNRTFRIDSKECTNVYIDLFRLFPIASIDKEIINFPITMKQDIDKKIINANNTKIINLDHELYTLPEILKTYDTNVLKYFLEDFKKYFTSTTLNYIVPDYVNIFEFTQVKKMINSYFPKSRNIPKSILAGLESLFTGTLQENDTLIYIQKNHDNDLYVTPLLVKYDKVLQDITNGLYIEKHPTKKIEEDTDSINNLNEVFKDEVVSQKLLSKFLQNGIKGIKKERIAFYLNEEIIYLKDVKSLPNQKNRTNKIKSLFRNQLLFKNKYIEIRDKNEENLYNFDKLLQYEKDGIILWKEHLPKLTMGNILMPKGYFGEFILVDDDSEVVNGCIDIQEHFNIPPNVSEISFPLILDDEDTGYEAFITSNEFPLKNSIECELKLTYNYETETPYELTFIALNNEIKPLKVSWKKIRHKEYSELPIPNYPEKKSWDELRNDPIEREGYKDLLRWISERLEILKDINIVPVNIMKKELKALKKQNKNIQEGYFLWGKNDKNGKFFCFVEVENEKVFCHSNNFKEKVDMATFYEGMPVYLQVKNKPDGLIGNNIFFTNMSENTLIEKIKKDYSNKQKSEKLEYMLKAMRSVNSYPVKTIWTNYSLSDLGTPNDFRIDMLNYINRCIEYMKDKDIPMSLKKEMFNFLSTLHQDMPIEISNTLVKYSETLNNDVNIALSIGDGKLKWQQTILNNIIIKLNNKESEDKVLRIMTISLWRSELLIDKLSKKEIEKTIKILIKYMNTDFQAIQSQLYSKSIENLVKRLELLLALLRARKNYNIFNPNEKLTKEYIDLIDSISKYILENNLVIKTRIQLDINKPKSFNETPDLLYALRVYLTADNGATNSIKVLGVSDD